MKEDVKFDQVERYLLGQMPPQEREAFEAQVAADPDLVRQVARQRAEHGLMEVLVEDDLRAKMRLWREQSEPQAGEDVHPGAVVLSIYRAAGWALLVLAVLGGLGLFFFLFFEKKNGLPVLPQPESRPKTEAPAGAEPKKDEEPNAVEPSLDKRPEDRPKSPKPSREQCLAIARAFREEPNFQEGAANAFTRGEGGESEAFVQALLDLHEKRWDAGLPVLLSIEPSSPNYPDAQFYAGLAFFEKNNFQAAALQLAKAAEKESYLYSERAAWMLALALLSDGDAARCGEVLKVISADEGHPFFSKAKALQEKLESAARQG